jgi:hypothetical protein
MDIPLLLRSHPRIMEAISSQLPTFPTAVLRLMVAGSRYILVSSARTAQETPLPTVSPLLRVTKLLPRNYCFSGPTVLALSKYVTICYVLEGGVVRDL